MILLSKKFLRFLPPSICSRVFTFRQNLSISCTQKMSFESKRSTTHSLHSSVKAPAYCCCKAAQLASKMCLFLLSSFSPLAFLLLQKRTQKHNRHVTAFPSFPSFCRVRAHTFFPLLNILLCVRYIKI